jgi:hypothetical protein
VYWPENVGTRRSAVSQAGSAQFLSFACHLTLLATSPCWPPATGLLGVVIGSIGLVTFRIGKELIGGAEATAKIFRRHQLLVPGGGSRGRGFVNRRGLNPVG